MKKTYVKPAVYAESFELMEHVAGDCLTGDNFSGALHRGNQGCGYDIGGVVLFGQGQNGCGNDEFQAMMAFAGSNADNPAQVAKDLGLECYNSFYDQAMNFFAS
ncbi:MAG: hypothetical protein IJI27_04290 [Oscillospiraceae bacterium]|nr:hypothetical protein [Oscillospiraceae bacterium]